MTKFIYILFLAQLLHKILLGLEIQEKGEYFLVKLSDIRNIKVCSRSNTSTLRLYKIHLLN